jgi:flagellin-specific chaperone FliS
MSNLQSVTQVYRMNQINSAGPLDLVLIAYDAALAGCGQRDLGRTTRALSVLRNALDFSYDVDIAMGLFRLYQYCAELARQGDYDQAAHLLRELRQAWAQVKVQAERDAEPVLANLPGPAGTISPPAGLAHDRQQVSGSDRPNGIVSSHSMAAIA